MGIAFIDSGIFQYPDFLSLRLLHEKLWDLVSLLRQSISTFRNDVSILIYYHRRDSLAAMKIISSCMCDKRTVPSIPDCAATDGTISGKQSKFHFRIYAVQVAQLAEDLFDEADSLGIGNVDLGGHALSKHVVSSDGALTEH